MLESLDVMDSTLNMSLNVLVDELFTAKDLQFNDHLLFDESKTKLKKRMSMWEKMMKKYEKNSEECKVGSYEVKVTNLSQPFTVERGTITSSTAVINKICQISQDTCSRSNKMPSKDLDTPSEENRYNCSILSSLMCHFKCSASLKLCLPSQGFTMLRSKKECGKGKFVKYSRVSLNEKSLFATQSNEISSNSNKFIMTEDECVRNYRSHHINGNCEMSLEKKKVLCNYKQNTCSKLEYNKMKKVRLSGTYVKRKENNPSDDEIIEVSKDSKKSNCIKNTISKFQNEPNNSIPVSDSAPKEKNIIRNNISAYDTTFVMARKNGKIIEMVESINCIFEKERTEKLRPSTSSSMFKDEYEEYSENVSEGSRKYKKKCKSIETVCIDLDKNSMVMNSQQSCNYILSKKINFQKELETNRQITEGTGGGDDKFGISKKYKKESNCSSDTYNELKSIMTKKLIYSDSMYRREFTLNSEGEKCKSESNVTPKLEEKDNIDAHYMTVRTSKQNDPYKRKRKLEYSLYSHRR